MRTTGQGVAHHLAPLISRLPAGLQPRVRLMFAGWALLFCVLNGLSLFAQPTPTSLRLLAATATLHFISSIWFTERAGGRPRLIDIPLDAISIVAFTVGLGDPLQVLGVVYALLLYRSQFGPTWRTLLFVPAYSVAYLTGVALAPAPLHQGLHWHDAMVLSMLPGLVVVGVLMRLLAITLAHADRSALRSRTVAEAGEALLRAGCVEEILPPALTALESLLGTVRNRPEAAVLLALTDGELLEVRAVAGASDDPAYGDERLTGTVLPVGALRAFGASAGRLPVTGELATALARLGGPNVRGWQVVPLVAHGQLHGCLLLRDGARLPRELDSTLVTLATQLGLAVAARRAEEELSRRAWSDGLTALPNRGLFTRALEDARTRHAAAPERLAVVFVDLDDFKAVNDTLGHEAGDELLVQVSERLRQSVRPQDLAARLGGDEFAVVLDGVESADEALAVGHRLVESLRRPFELTADVVRIGASVGIALGHTTLDAAETVRCADVAMYTAKAQGKGRVLVFDHGDGGTVAAETVPGSAELPAGLSLHYRPRVDLGAGVPRTSEVLLRWVHPQFGVLHGRAALTQAAFEGFGAAVAEWLLESACRQALAWRAAQGPSSPGVSAPLSAEMLAASDVVESVARVLTRVGAPAGLLTVQVPSDAFAVRAARQAVGGLADLGVHVAAETDGRAGRSLAAAQALPVEELLIDVGSLSDLTFARALCVVAERTGVTPVAVGVDDGAAASLVEELGIHVAQGEAVAPVVSGDHPTGWLATPTPS